MALGTSTMSLPTLLRQATSEPAKGRPETAATSAKQKIHAPYAIDPRLTSNLTPNYRRPSSASAIRSPGPFATIGKGPGHEDAYKVRISPGPSDYSKREMFSTTGGNYFTSADRDRERNKSGRAVEERRQFRQLDENHNGVLDFDEACKLFLRGKSNLQHVEIKALFDNIDASKDGKIQFQELHDFLFSSSIKSSAWRSRLRSALRLVDPGPGDYYSEKRAALSQHKRSGKAILSGPGHDLFRPKTSGPASYDVKYSAVLRHAPRASFGKGPGHQALAKTSHDSFFCSRRPQTALLR